MNEEVIYFSLYNERKESFYDYIKGRKICYKPKFSFRLTEKDTEFKDPRDLLPIIEGSLRKDSLHIIIDYISCCDYNNANDNAAVIRDIIMAYPEVQFLFDETFVAKKEKLKNNYSDFRDFLFLNCSSSDEVKCVLADFHHFNLGDFSDNTIEEQFIYLLRGRNNMYDASNLRYAIKKSKFDKLNVSDNYTSLTESRKNNVAVTVDEEYHQSMFNGYCLFANGYRVFPIMSAKELLWINNLNDEKIRDSLLIRDYDLQFLDEDKVNPSSLTLQKVTISDPKNANKTIEVLINKVDYIRGAKACYEKNNSDENIFKFFKAFPFSKNDNENPFWKIFSTEKTFFISKGDIHLKIDLNEKTTEPMNDNDEMLCLKGLKKPIEGIYASIQRIKDVKVHYNNSHNESGTFVTRRKDENGHSCSLDIYGVARSMVHRAEKYYKNGRHRLAALIAGEALGVLNGFHKSLMYQAYYIQAVSENAMAMSLLGGDEQVLQKDVSFRLKEKVKKDIDRMVIEPKDRCNLYYNIYNDCMLFCQEKEYFDAADEALNTMVQLKEGTDFNKCCDAIKNWFVNFFRVLKQKTTRND